MERGKGKGKGERERGKGKRKKGNGERGKGKGKGEMKSVKGIPIRLVERSFILTYAVNNENFFTRKPLKKTMEGRRRGTEKRGKAYYLAF